MRLLSGGVWLPPGGLAGGVRKPCSESHQEHFVNKVFCAESVTFSLTKIIDKSLSFRNVEASINHL
jgi:hypothetical protein